MRDRRLAESTRARYQEVLGRLVRQDTDGVCEFIARIAATAATDGLVRQLKAALRLHKIRGLNWPLIEETHKAAKAEIRRRRLHPPTRPTLTGEEMEGILSHLEEDGVLAYIFALQTFLVWRYDSLRELRPEHCTVNRNCWEVVVVKEKVMRNQGAPRTVKGIPVVIAERWPLSARWQPVVVWLLEQLAVAGRGEVSALAAIPQNYEEYLAGVKTLLDRRAPRLREVVGVGAHVARRTGACLHKEEGWSHKAIMHMGGWASEQQFQLYLDSITALTSL